MQAWWGPNTENVDGIREIPYIALFAAAASIVTVLPHPATTRVSLMACVHVDAVTEHQDLRLVTSTTRPAWVRDEVPKRLAVEHGGIRVPNDRDPA